MRRGRSLDPVGGMGADRGSPYGVQAVLRSGLRWIGRMCKVSSSGTCGCGGGGSGGSGVRGCWAYRWAGGWC